MKLKNARIIVKPISDVKSEWKSALKGKKQTIQKSNQIIFTSFDAVSKVFSKTRMTILKTIIAENPESIYELAKKLDRDFKNVYTDVNFLSQIGLIELKKLNNSRGGIKPIAKFSGIKLDFAA